MRSSALKRASKARTCGFSGRLAVGWFVDSLPFLHPGKDDLWLRSCLAWSTLGQPLSVALALAKAVQTHLDPSNAVEKV